MRKKEPRILAQERELLEDQPNADANHETRATVTSLHDDVVSSVRPALLVLLAAVGCVLLIACANASSLVLVRAAARTREMSIRRALGASPRRLVRQMLAESLVLAAAGGVAGVGIASWAMPLLLRLAPQEIPRLEEVRIEVNTAADRNPRSTRPIRTKP